jgi:hypothetical protein
LVACCTPNYTLEMHDGIKAIPKDHTEMLQSFRPTRWQLFTKLVLPSIVPFSSFQAKKCLICPVPSPGPSCSSHSSCCPNSLWAKQRVGY